MTDLTDFSLEDQIEGLSSKKFSSVELTSSYLKKIEEQNKVLNCFISINENALDEAKKSDLKIAKNDKGIMEGIPVAHKDIFCIKDQVTTCGSKMLENFVSPYSSTVYEKLFNSGTVNLGKTNMDEFAMGSANTTSYFGNVINPLNPHSDKKKKTCSWRFFWRISFSSFFWALLRCNWIGYRRLN